MKRTIASLTLILLIIPFLMGCEIKPQDKWPLITCWENVANFDVTLKLLEGFGIPQLIIPDRTVAMTIDVQSYHAEQGYTVRVFLVSVEHVYTVYSNNMPGASYMVALPITEVHTRYKVSGEYLSGTPPQGIAELAVNMTPLYFPLAINDWIDYDIDPNTGGLSLNWVTDRYKYNFRVVVEDKDGRSDTYTFEIISNLIVDTKK